VNFSLTLVLSESAKQRPDAVAVVDGDVRLTYRDTWQRSLRVAGLLRERGVGPGDHVGLVMVNSLDFVAAYFGTLAVGATIVPLAPMMLAGEAARMMGDVRASALIGHAPTAALAAALSRELPEMQVIDVAAAEASDPIPYAVARESGDVAVVLFTSGTTGRPKGAMLTHGGMLMNATVSAFDGSPLTPDDVFIACLPMFHVYGQSFPMNTAFRLGARAVIQRRFDPARTLELMCAEGVTVFAGVPTMFVQLLAAAEQAAELPAVRIAASGGAALPVAVLSAFEERFGAVVYEGYGLSESSSCATSNQDLFGRRVGSVGHPIWGVDVEIADPTQPSEIVLLGPGERGEVVIRGHNVFAGYLDDPVATAAAVVDGWLRTGDIGVKDAEGFISILDRTKDLIIRGGYNVYPRELEEVLIQHPAVAQVAVVGIPDPALGEEVCAVVTVDAGCDLDAEDLLAYGAERIAPHKRPRVVRVLDALPLGPSNKVLKRELRELVARDL